MTKAIAIRYRWATKVDTGRILGELCATTDWHPSHARKALAPALSTLVLTRRRFAELKVSDATAAQLLAMSPATIDRRPAPNRAAMTLKVTRAATPWASTATP